MNIDDLKRRLEKAENKIELIKDKNIVSKYCLQTWQIVQLIISFLGDEDKEDLLNDKDFIESSLGLKKYEIANLIEKLNSQEVKEVMIEKYNLADIQIVGIIRTFPDEKKEEIILNRYKLSEYSIILLLSSFSEENMVDFIKNHKDFLLEKDIKPYEFIKLSNKEVQKKVIFKIDEINLDAKEIKKIYATLDKNLKKEINKSLLDDEFIQAVEMQISEEVKTLGKIIVDFNKDLEVYRGLDELLYINPMNLSQEEKCKLSRLFQICPDVRLRDNIDLGESTVEEYINAERWIQDIIDNIDENWNDLQKLAYIDNAVGKRITYSPDDNTEVEDMGEQKALWKIIYSGYGVCNGIAQVEKYILDKVGIESEIIKARNHAFLKIKNLTYTNKEGKVVYGDTVLDPTWNLTAHKFGAKPENFCRSYKEIRKHDIDKNGKDWLAHKNDDELSDAILELDEVTLRDVFSSIGLADSKGEFPIKGLMDKSKEIDTLNLLEEESVENQLKLLADYYPKFAISGNSTIKILETILLNQPNFKFNRCVIDRVYSKDDNKKRPLLYVYIDFPKTGKKFYYADKEYKKFIKLTQEEFEIKFECYEKDIESFGGIRPWKQGYKEDNSKDLNKSSGTIVIEGEEK